MLPKSLPRSTLAPVTLVLESHLVDPSHFVERNPSSATIDFGREAGIDSSDFPTCGRAQLERPVLSSRLTATCRAAEIGTGWAYIASVANRSEPDTRVALTLFNGGKHGNQTYVFVRGQGIVSSLAVVRIWELRSGPRAVVSFPVLPAGLVLVRFAVRLPRNGSTSFGLAKCPKTGKLQATLGSYRFDNGDRYGGQSIIRTCTARLHGRTAGPAPSPDSSL